MQNPKLRDRGAGCNPLVGSGSKYCRSDPLRGPASAWFGSGCQLPIGEDLSKNKTVLWYEVSVFGLKGRFIQPRPSGLGRG